MEYFVYKYDIDCAAGGERAALEDSIMRKGSPAAAGSKMLDGFVSPIGATVVTRLEEAGISILGKTRMDEFGASGLFDEPTEERGEGRSGAVAVVADGAADFALCNDYTGAVGVVAAACGLYYIHPTYGTVSRYGLIPAVPSMDQIGVLCKTPEEGFRVLAAIAGYDPKDGAMLYEGIAGGEATITVIPDLPRNPPDNVQYPGDCGSESLLHRFGAPAGGGDGAALRIGVPANVLAGIPAAPDIVEFCKNHETVEFELKYYDVYAQVMQILCCAELCNCISRYDGIKFGYRAKGYKGLRELYTKSRTEALGADAKLAALAGAMVLSQEHYVRYYDKAMRIRRLIKESLEFDRYDAIVVPALSGSGARDVRSGAHDVERETFGLALRALPRLCGLPAITAPFQGGGFTLIAGAGREDVLFKAVK